MGIAPENLFKAELVDDPGIIKAALSVGEGDLPLSPEPSANGVQAVQVFDDALHPQDEVIVNVLSFQGDEGTAPA